VNETNQCIDNVKRLRLSDVHKHQSRYERIIRHFPKEMGNSDETKHRNKEKISPEILATIAYIEQLIQKIAPPLFQKLERV